MSCLVSRKKENPNQIVVTRGYASNKGGMTSSWVYTYEADRITLTRESIMQSNDAYNSIFIRIKINYIVGIIGMHLLYCLKRR